MPTSLGREDGRWTSMGAIVAGRPAVPLVLDRPDKAHPILGGEVMLVLGRYWSAGWSSGAYLATRWSWMLPDGVRQVHVQQRRLFVVVAHDPDSGVSRWRGQQLRALIRCPCPERTASLRGTDGDRLRRTMSPPLDGVLCTDPARATTVARRAASRAVGLRPARHRREARYRRATLRPEPCSPPVGSATKARTAASRRIPDRSVWISAA